MAGSGWGASVQGRAACASGVVLALMFAILGVQRRDGEAIGFAVLALAAAAGSRIRRGLLGRLALGFVAIDTVVWLAPAALANARSGEDLLDVVAPAVLCAIAIAMLLLVAGGPPKAVLVMGAVLVAASVGISAAASGKGSSAVPDAALVTKNMVFSPDRITVRSGDLVAASNSDLFWHSFTVPAFDIDARVPTGATRVVRIDAPPGVYRFVCAIPGHEAAGMDGVLVVR